MLFKRHHELPTSDRALPGRVTRPFSVGGVHAVLGTPIEGAIPDGYQEAVFGLGCFWGEEKAFWQVPGVWTTSVGYAGGMTPNPTYEEVCSGRTGHVEVVRLPVAPGVLGARVWPHEHVLGHRDVVRTRGLRQARHLDQAVQLRRREDAALHREGQAERHQLDLSRNPPIRARHSRSRVMSKDWGDGRSLGTLLPA